MDRGFLFFPSYAEAVKNMSDEQAGKYIKAIIAVFEGSFEADSVDDQLVKVSLNLTMPTINKSIINSENGRRGGAPYGNQNAAKKQPKTSEKQAKNNRKTSREGEREGEREREGEFIDIDNTSDREKHSLSAENNLDQKKASPSEFSFLNFDYLWELYPKKAGRHPAMLAYIKAREDGITDEQIENGIVRYKNKLKKDKTIDRFILTGQRFFEERRYLDEANMELTEEEKDREYWESVYADTYI